MKLPTLREHCDPRDLALMRIASWLDHLAAEPSSLAESARKRAITIRRAVFEDNYAAIFPLESDGLP